ncbi:hypothetical protein V6N13_053043 [Hibiscus sabdariffa]|uniref:Uncharacterized protein n=1 Tax=Hibiscus sabdariffa TaxID=183260 RepID=A0ABR2Q6L6_9ROSI
MQVKQPGVEMSTVQSELDLSYRQRYQGVTIPEDYEPHRIDKGEMKPIPYQATGSCGPAEADELSAKAGYVQTHGYIRFPPTLLKKLDI